MNENIAIPIFLLLSIISVISLVGNLIRAKKTAPIPWKRIYKEYIRCNDYPAFSYFICTRSKTFSKYWKLRMAEIKDKVNEFLEIFSYDDVCVPERSLGPLSSLFFYDGCHYEIKEKVRIDFLKYCAGIK